MKKLFLFLSLCCISFFSFSQYVYQIKADSVRIHNDSCKAELILENSTKNINGFLYNRGNGRTEFAYAIDSVWLDDNLFLKFRVGPNILSFNLNATNVGLLDSLKKKIDSAWTANDSLFLHRGDTTITVPVGNSYTFNPPFLVNGKMVSIPGYNNTNWDAAYSWGNHAGLYPLMSGSYTNPSWIASLAWSKISGIPTEFTPSANSAYYLQNQSSISQSASAWINGNFYISDSSSIGATANEAWGVKINKSLAGIVGVNIRNRLASAFVGITFQHATEIAPISSIKYSSSSGLTITGGGRNTGNTDLRLQANWSGNVDIYSPYLGKQLAKFDGVTGKTTFSDVVNLASLATDPASNTGITNGSVFYSSTLNRFRGNVGGTIQSFMMLNDTSMIIRNNPAAVQMGGFNLDGKSTIINTGSTAGLIIKSRNPNNGADFNTMSFDYGGIHSSGNLYGTLMSFTGAHYVGSGSIISIKPNTGYTGNAIDVQILNQHTSYSPTGINVLIDRGTIENSSTMTSYGGRFIVRPQIGIGYGLYIKANVKQGGTGNVYGILVDSGQVVFKEKFSALGAQEVKRTVVTTATTLNDTHYYIAADATTVGFSINLPQASTCVGRIYRLKKIDASANVITITPNGSDTIEGATSYLLSTQWQKVTLIAASSGWEIF